MHASLQDLAEYMADFFSADAAYWPLTRTVTDAAILVGIRWFGSVITPANRELLGCLRSVLATPYRAHDSDHAAELVFTTDEAKADAVIILAEVPQEGAAGIAYEVQFTQADDRYPGWFALPAA